MLTKCQSTSQHHENNKKKRQKRIKKTAKFNLQYHIEYHHKLRFFISQYSGNYLPPFNVNLKKNHNTTLETWNCSYGSIAAKKIKLDTIL
jgi:hypothetical protein